MADAPIERFDEHGIGLEPNNLAAIDSLLIYRRLRFGRNVDLVLTDNRSFQTECAMERAEAEPFQKREFTYLVPEEVIEIFDAGRAYGGGASAETIRLRRQGSAERAQELSAAHDARRDAESLVPRTAALLAARPGRSGAIRSARSSGAPIRRICPPELVGPWPGAGYASLGGSDWSGYLIERAEIFDFVREQRITGFAIVVGRPPLASGPDAPRRRCRRESSSQSASRSSPARSPRRRCPKVAEHNLPKDYPLRSLYVHQTAPGAPYERT